ncbi:MAG: hypothetical protein AAF226_04740 [Verrucomicrobiota bacterium]
MKVAVVHYHLRRGGVTQVISSAQQAVRDKGVEMVVMSGEELPEGLSIDNVIVEPGLSYRKTAYLSVAESLVESLKARAEKHFGCQPDLWHFHNHSLGKNVLTPLVVRGLAEEGAHVLLQMHDFPEDGRPSNYVAQRMFFDSDKEFQKSLYPTGSHIHYAPINGRDFGFLKSAGIKDDQLHLLPNAVSGVETECSPEDRPFAKDKEFILYPTRAIRRKNLGEMLLLSILGGDDRLFATSLVPENSDWVPIHDKWSALVDKLELPIQLGAAQGEKYRFVDLVGWCDMMITTSVAEGFGLAFLEPCLVGKSIVGRNLPRITADFTNDGVDLNHLYDRIEIPLDWVDQGDLRGLADDALARTYLAYDRKLPRKAAEKTFSRWITDGTIDFGCLNEATQTKVIERIADSSAAATEITGAELKAQTPEFIARQKQAVETNYSLAAYGDNLKGVYDKVLSSSVSKTKHLPPGKVLDQFLDPWRLNLLRSL